MNHETEAGAVLVMASGFLFYVVLETPLVGALLVTGGAWTMMLPRVLRSDDSTSW